MDPQAAVKLVIDCLDRALQLEEFAARETDATFKRQLLAKADVYRKRAVKHAAHQRLSGQSAPDR